MSTELSINSLFPLLSNKSLGAAKADARNTTFVGIDFGTSTTVVSIAIYKDGNEPINLSTIEIRQKYLDGSTMTSYKVPSIIAWKDEKLLFGYGAEQLKYRLKPGINLWHSFKMELGEDVGCKYPGSELGKNSKYTILNPVDAVIYFFKFLKIQVEKYVVAKGLPNRIEYAVSIPASFEANQRKDLVEALETNGFQISKQSLIDEPNAAFLSYVSNPDYSGKIKIPNGYNPYILVFDFGAGTCDISILEVGEDNKGFYSKNIAISKFEKLGGNDIDRLIAIDILLPQLLKPYGLKTSDFRTRELKVHIIPNLLQAAENLKIRISEEIALKLSSQELQEILASDSEITIGSNIVIDTRKGLLTLNEARLKYSEFASIMEVFISPNRSFPTKRIEQEFEFIGISSPIDSALKKAKISKKEIDYLLFIGGSSKNPMIQNALINYLPEADPLLPNDMQAHVSAGAAIHSLIFNGFGKNLIQPITSEAIFLIVSDDNLERMEVLIEPGTVIPCELKTISNLRPQRDGQEIIELPICVGNKNKLLYNIKISHPDGFGFSLSESIRLDFEINADKMLLIRAVAANKAVEVEPLSPYSNKELTTEQRIIMHAERKFNLACNKNGGEPTLESLQALYQVYRKVKQEFKAAETLEQIAEMFPKQGSLHSIGYHYKQAGKKSKALEFYNKSLEYEPHATTAFNIAMIYKHEDIDLFRRFLEEAIDLNPEDCTSRFELGKLLINEGEDERGNKLINGAFQSWKRKFESDQMQEWDFSWFSSCAAYLGKHDLADEIKRAEKKMEKPIDYNPENLTRPSSLDQRKLLNE